MAVLWWPLRRRIAFITATVWQIHFCKANIPALSPTCSDLYKTVFNTLLSSYVLSRHSENENLPCVVFFSLFFFSQEGSFFLCWGCFTCWICEAFLQTRLYFPPVCLAFYSCGSVLQFIFFHSATVCALCPALWGAFNVAPPEVHWISPAVVSLWENLACYSDLDIAPWKCRRICPACTFPLPLFI